MNKFIILLLTYLTIMTLTACGGDDKATFPPPLSPNVTDSDGDGKLDDVDIDDDGDGLIEIDDAAGFYAVRYQLDGTGKRASVASERNTTGCGGSSAISQCFGYELIANISLASYAEGKGWLPIGSDEGSSRNDCNSAAFSALFEGNGLEVRDLVINRAEADCVGLFSNVSGEIRNLGVRGDDITGGRYVGGLVGVGEDARIINSSVAVDSVFGTGGSVGGLVGSGWHATITNSSAAVDSVLGDAFVGGLVGEGSRTTIISSYVVVGSVTGDARDVGGLVGSGDGARITSSSAVVGSVTGDIFVGGLVGFGDGARITSSSAVVGAVTGDIFVGGLVGEGSEATIISSYVVVGSVTGDDHVGGLVGSVYSATIRSSYWDNTTSGIVTDIYGNPQTSVALQTPTSYTGIYTQWENQGCGWDFGTSFQYPAIPCLPITLEEQRSFYRVVDGDVRVHIPSFPSGPRPEPTPPPNVADSDGDGKLDDVDIDDDGDGLIEIAAAAGLYAVRYQLDGTGKRASAAGERNTAGCGGSSNISQCFGYELTANISLASYAEGKGWLPIGSDEGSSVDDCSGAAFSVLFEGNGLEVRDLVINRAEADCVGLFSNVSGEIRNLGVRGGDIIGGRYVGGLVGVGEDARIINSSVAVDSVFGTGDSVGGLVGDGGYAKITSSAAAVGSVTGDDNVGGLVGDGGYANITSSAAAVGSVTGDDNVGGLVGVGEGARIINSSVAVDSVFGTGDSVGGLVGDGGYANITSSAAAVGSVLGNNHSVGGLVGKGSRAIITSSAAEVGSVFGNNHSVGGLVGDGDYATITFSFTEVDFVTGGEDLVGGLVGSSWYATITSSAAVVGAVTGDDNVGGLVGDVWYATIVSSAVVVDSVFGDEHVGGLVGEGSRATIISSAAVVGAVTGTDDVGGLMGFGGGARITSSYTVVGFVTGTDNVGGLVGSVYSATIRSSYWDSDTSGIATGVYGAPQTSLALQGPTSYTGIYAQWENQGCGWDFGTDSQYPAIRCLPITPEKQRSFYRISGGDVRVHIPSFPSAPLPSSPSDPPHITPTPAPLPPLDILPDTVPRSTEICSSSGSDCDGDGKLDDVDIDDDGDGLIEIAAAAELDAVRYQLNGTGKRASAESELNTTGCGGSSNISQCFGYELTANISLAAYGAGQGWVPIGSAGESSEGCGGASFGALLDGNGWEIRDLVINRAKENCVGLFSNVSGEIRNLGVRGGNITGSRYVGGLVGWGSGATITNSSAVVDAVIGNDDDVGGLVGWGSGATITNSAAVVGAVTGSSDSVGGLVGDGEDAWIISSVAVVGAVTGDYAVGGLVGSVGFSGSGATITSSAAVVGAVTGDGSVGGLVGDGEGARITSSAAVVDTVIGNDDDVGGLVGWGRSARITSSYGVVGAVIGDGSVGGLVGDGRFATITSSYTVVGAVTGNDDDVGGLVGDDNSAIIRSSYWDSTTSGIATGSHSSPQTSSALQTPTSYTGIYAQWENQGCGWDFGTAAQYPAIRCLLITPEKQRSFYRVSDGVGVDLYSFLSE